MNIQKAKQELAIHLQNRILLRKYYQQKGILMLDKPQIPVSEVNQTMLEPAISIIYDQMTDELKQQGYYESKLLGKGAQGFVLLAKQQETNIRFAIKGVFIRDQNGKIDDESNELFEKEKNLLNKCKGSPYVLNLIKQFEGKYVNYLVLSECKGTLRELIESTSEKRLNELSTIKYSRDIAEGLSYIHNLGCIVNDLKMDNILIDYRGNAVISDFGLADDLPKISGYGAKEFVGNFYFWAPELYSPSDFNEYQDEYNKLGIIPQTKPSQKSEACSFGYLIYVMISGLKLGFISNKHKPMAYNSDFQNFQFYQQLKDIIDGLTQFIPSDRLSVKDALNVLKNITSQEIQLDENSIELIKEETRIELTEIYKEVEFVQCCQSEYYPIIKDEEMFLQEIESVLNEINGLPNDNNSLLTQNVEIKLKIANLEEKIHKEKQESQQYKQQVKQLAQKQDFLVDKINELQEKIVTFEKQLLSKEDHSDQLKAATTATTGTENQPNDFESQNQISMNKIILLEQQQSINEKKINELKDSVIEYQKKIYELQSQNEISSNKIAQQEQQLKEKEQKINELKDSVIENQKKPQEQQSQDKVYSNKITQQEQQLQEKEQKINELKDSIIECQKKLQEQQSYNELSSSKIAQQEQQLKEKEQKINELKDSVIENQKNSQEQQSQDRTSSTQQEQQLQEKEQKINELKDSIIECQKKLQEQQSCNEISSSKIAQQEQQLKEKENKIKETKDKQAQIEKKLQESESQNEKLKSQLSLLQKELKEKNCEHVWYQRKFTQGGQGYVRLCKQKGCKGDAYCKACSVCQDCKKQFGNE